MSLLDTPPQPGELSIPHFHIPLTHPPLLCGRWSHTAVTYEQTAEPQLVAQPVAPDPLMGPPLQVGFHIFGVSHIGSVLSFSWQGQKALSYNSTHQGSGTAKAMPPSPQPRHNASKRAGSPTGHPRKGT